tara:strand:+ start:520 stop:1770 length:1251 start_codon:yes stop_codon:yes gene_type:complete
VPIRGSITIPGDKSISHRALLISSLIPGKNVIKNLSTAKDVEHTLKCLNSMGINSMQDDSSLIIQGGTFRPTNKPLFCGNSGTTMRLLLGLLSGLNMNAELFGDDSLIKRPMNRIINPLRKMGANISQDNKSGSIIIEKTDELIDLKHYMSVSSAQVKSSLLLAGLCGNKKIIIHEQYQTRDHTEIMLKNIGHNIVCEDNIITFNPTVKNIQNINVNIPGDISSASFFIGAACMIPNSDLRINNVLINNTRMGFINVLKKMGAGIIIHNSRQINGEKIADIQVYYKPLYGINITKEDIPLIIDELPILSIVATQAEGMMIVSGAEELRYKESDRIRSIVSNLSKMGAKIIEKNDGFFIEGPNILNKTIIETYDDHRIAMSFIIAGISSGNYNEIDNTECINNSYPEFIEVLKKVIR